MSTDSGKLYPSLPQRADAFSISPSVDKGKVSDRSDVFLQTLESLSRDDRSTRLDREPSARERRINERTATETSRSGAKDRSRGGDASRHDRVDATEVDAREHDGADANRAEPSADDRTSDVPGHNVDPEQQPSDAIDSDQQPGEHVADEKAVVDKSQSGVQPVEADTAEVIPELTEGDLDTDAESDTDSEVDPAADLLAIATQLFGSVKQTAETENSEQVNVSGQAKQGDKPTTAATQQAASADISQQVIATASSAEGETSNDSEGDNPSGSPAAFAQAARPTVGSEQGFGLERAGTTGAVPITSGVEAGGPNQLAIAGVSNEARASNQVQAARVTIPLPSTGTPEGDANVARVARGLSSALSQNGGSVTLRLSPPEMGLVRIEMELNNGVIRAQLTAQSESARSLLGQQLSHLRQTLEAQGLSVDRLEVQTMNSNSSSGLADEQGDTDHGQNDGRSQGRFEREPEHADRQPRESTIASDFDSALEAQNEVEEVNAVA